MEFRLAYSFPKVSNFWKAPEFGKLPNFIPFQKIKLWERLELCSYYHIYTHANGSEDLFRADENYRFFMERYAKYISPIADTFCYCLMPNHLHLLIRTKSGEQLSKSLKLLESSRTFGKLISKQFANLFSSYTQSYNKVYHRKGSLFIPNFKRKEIKDEDGFTKIIHYIHANPAHHGFVKSAKDWRWSSYHSLLSDKPTLLPNPTARSMSLS